MNALLRFVPRKVLEAAAGLSDESGEGSTQMEFRNVSEEGFLQQNLGLCAVEWNARRIRSVAQPDPHLPHREPVTLSAWYVVGHQVAQDDPTSAREDAFLRS